MTTALVTGSSTGIGYATALRLARDRHHVVATMRNPESSDITSVAKDHDLDLEVRPLDVTDDDSVKTLFESIGDVDILVNNAGISIGGVIEETSLDEFRETMETNFFGAIRCMKTVLPSMRERRSGCIVNVSSQAGRFATPGLSSYGASKWALESVSETLACEVAEFGIRVLLIEPGAIITPILQKARYPSPDSPYAKVHRRFGIVALHDFGQGSMPDVVADCIAEAITARPYRLRWLTGMGAERNVANREALSDEDAIALWTLDDNAFRAAMLGEEA